MCCVLHWRATQRRGTPLHSSIVYVSALNCVRADDITATSLTIDAVNPACEMEHNSDHYDAPPKHLIPKICVDFTVIGMSTVKDATNGAVMLLTRPLHTASSKDRFTMFSLPFRRSPLIRPVRSQILPAAARPLHQSTCLRARKDTQDKDSLKPEASEYSKSGSDDKAAAMDDAAFNPDKTRPEEEHNSAGRESGGDGVSFPGHARECFGSIGGLQ